MHHDQLRFLAQQPAQQVRQFRQHLGDVKQPRLQRLLAREGQQLAHQRRRAVGVLLDLHNVGEGLIAGPVALQQQVAKTDHRGQHVIEVMRDAAGQLAYRLHLLRLRQLGFQRFLLGVVDDQKHQAGRAFEIVLQPAGENRGHRLAGPLDTHLKRLGGRLALQDRLQFLRDDNLLVVANIVEDRLARRAGVVDKLLEGLVAVADSQPLVDQRNADRHFLKQPLETAAPSCRRGLRAVRLRTPAVPSGPFSSACETCRS